MSSNKTEHLALHLWEDTDEFRRSEFNENFQAVDAGVKVAEARAAGALAAMPRMAVGSYAGTGGYGAGSPNTLTFDFEPKLVVVAINAQESLEQGTVLIAGQTASSGVGASYSSGATLKLQVSWPERAVRWYSSTASNQMNKSGMTYFYFAIG